MSLQLRDLSVDIGATRIVSDVSFTVADGTFAGLLGPNGSGKSTILKTIYRLLRPAAGDVLLNGEPIHGLAPRDVARRVAVVSQDNTIEFDLSVAEMVILGRLPHQRRFEGDTDTDRAVVADALTTVGCAALAQRSFHTLSGGEKQRVLVARALAQQADHLILDEPTSHLDIRYQTEVLDLVAGLGVTVLAALHDLGLAGLYCDEIHLLSAGRLCTSGHPAEVITVDRVQQIYGADVLVIPHPETGTPQLLARRATSTAIPSPTPAGENP
jgi:iron complex transport system ATP-binding protein